MSKELTPLEALEEIKNDVVAEYIDDYKEHFKIIETELIEKEEQDNVSKVLEIIKERMRIEFHEYPNGRFHVVAFPKEQTGVGLGAELYLGNCKETYDLLKEVLSCQ